MQLRTKWLFDRFARRRRSQWAIALAVFAHCFSASAQGTFQNLDFEDANVAGSTPIPSFVPIGEALPGWSGELINTSTLVGTPQTEAVYNGISTGGPVISLIIDNNAPFFPKPIDGNDSAFLCGGGVGTLLSPLFSTSISQTGIVPTGTESLQFDAYVFGAPFAVTLGGQTIDMTPLQTFAHYTLWGGNIPSSSAGQTETLTFTEPPPSGTAPPSMFELDDISFSPTTVIPEPEPVALMSIGGFLFALYRRFAGKRL